MTKLMRMCVCMYAVHTQMYMNLSPTPHMHINFATHPLRSSTKFMYTCEGVSGKIYVHVCVHACKEN